MSDISICFGGLILILVLFGLAAIFAVVGVVAPSQKRFPSAISALLQVVVNLGAVVGFYIADSAVNPLEIFVNTYSGCHNQQVDWVDLVAIPWSLLIILFFAYCRNQLNQSRLRRDDTG